jgi:hypothetical protein
MISPERRNEVIDALLGGTVPQRSLDAFAVGLQPFEAVIGDELESVRRGRAQFKAVRGEYGSGKTFFARWLQERAKRLGFATAEVQISETETPLHRVETVYRRLMERLATGDSPSGAFRSIVDGWFFALEQDVLAEGTAASGEEPQLIERTNALMEQRGRNHQTSAGVCRHPSRVPIRSGVERHGDGRRSSSLARRPTQCERERQAVGWGEG